MPEQVATAFCAPTAVAAKKNVNERGVPLTIGVAPTGTTVQPFAGAAMVQVTEPSVEPTTVLVKVMTGEPAVAAEPIWLVAAMLVPDGELAVTTAAGAVAAGQTKGQVRTVGAPPGGVRSSLQVKEALWTAAPRVQVKLIDPVVVPTLNVPLAGVVVTVPTGVKPAPIAHPLTTAVPAPAPAVVVLIAIVAFAAPAGPAGNVTVAAGAGA